jgi:hypothetical protein
MSCPEKTVVASDLMSGWRRLRHCRFGKSNQTNDPNRETQNIELHLAPSKKNAPSGLGRQGLQQGHATGAHNVKKHIENVMRWQKAKLFGSLMPTEVMVFDVEDLDDAKKWIVT